MITPWPLTGRSDLALNLNTVRQNGGKWKPNFHFQGSHAIMLEVSLKSNPDARTGRKRPCYLMYFKILWYHLHQRHDIQNWAQPNTGIRAPKPEKLDFYSLASSTSTPLVKPVVCQCSDKWLFIVGQQDWSWFSESWMGNTYLKWHLLQDLTTL